MASPDTTDRLGVVVGPVASDSLRPRQAERDARLRQWLLGVGVPLVVLASVVAADLAEGPNIDFVGVLVLVPMLSAVFCSALLTAGVGTVALLAGLAVGLVSADTDPTAQRIRLVIIGVTTAVASIAAAVRTRGERALAEARAAAVRSEVVQEEARRHFERLERRERQRRTYLQLLAEIDQLLTVDDERRVGSFQPLVERLVPILAARAVVEGADGTVVAASGAVSADHSTAGGVARSFDGGELGTMWLRIWRHRPAATDDERIGPFVEAVGERVSVALLRHETRLRQIDISAELQGALLPTALAQAPGVEVSGVYVPAGSMLDVGGDWYDSIALSDGRLLFVVGDVVGHGLQAGAIMGRLRSALAGIATLLQDPAELLVALDTYASRPDADVGFATVACAVLDPVTGALEYASAGHPPMLVVAPDGACRWLDRALSPPLATFLPDERPQAHEILEAGETLVMYTDGVVERRGYSIDVGLGELRRQARALRRHGASAMAHELVERLGVTGLADDTAVLVVRIGGRPTAPWSVTHPADVETLGVMRASAKAWLHELGVDRECVHDALVVLNEAAANSIDHAYVSTHSGSYNAAMSVSATGDLVVEVSDHGTWREPGLHSADRGRGTSLIEGLSASVRRHSDSSGTRVTARIPLRYRSSG